MLLNGNQNTFQNQCKNGLLIEMIAREYNHYQIKMNPYQYPFLNTYYGFDFAPIYYDSNSFYAFPQQQAISQQLSSVKVQQKLTDYRLTQQKSQIPPFQPQNEEIHHFSPSDNLTLKIDSKQKHAQKHETKKKSAKTPKKDSEQIVNKNRDYFKNFESNVVNKIFSFLWTKEKSIEVVQRLLKDKIKVGIYYEFMKIIKKFSKRYITKEYLANLSDFQEHHIAYKIVSKKTDLLQYFSFQEFSSTVRVLINYYLRNEVVISVLTSKKMRPYFWQAHIDRARNLNEIIFEKISLEEYNSRCRFMYRKMKQAGLSQI